jgi:CRISPR/Cas system CMR-associated protein Cmr3 (group 5 of RAMP superfamily)
LHTRIRLSDLGELGVRRRRSVRVRGIRGVVFYGWSIVTEKGTDGVVRLPTSYTCTQ